MLADIKDFVPLATPIVAATVAFFTVRFSARAFYRQRWWEKKADAYAQVLEALFHIDAYFLVLNEESLSGNDKDGKYKEGLLTRYSDGYSNVRKVAAMGPLFFSEEANTALREYIRHKPLNWGECSPYEYFEDLCTATETAIERIRTAAISDLGLQQGRY